MPSLLVGWWEMSLLLAIWVMGCGLRLRHGDRQVVIDGFMFGLGGLWLAREELLVLLPKILEIVQGESNNLAHCGKLYFATSFTIALTVIGFWRTLGKTSSSVESLPQHASKWSLEHPGPWIFPCRTTHARIFPERHVFGYTYLQCGYPITPVAITATGSTISDGRDRKLGNWWLRVKADDYLERGRGSFGFYNKLREYLRNQHIQDSDWSFAYLITAPRFLGYAFNPVSFWYIYDHEQELKMMILEVNNTFGERRMYLLDGSASSNTPYSLNSQHSSLSEESSSSPQKVKPNFTDLWTKDFHVSPFNSRKGSYALKALNPFPCILQKDPRIDNTITLKSSKDHAKLVARLYSTDKSFEPHQLGLAGTIWFVLSWWWVGFMTVPRILREAFRLFFRRSLHVWYRPEVLNSSVGRLPSSSEMTLYMVFKDYLRQFVCGKEGKFSVTLQTAIPDMPTDVLTSTSQHNRVTRNLEIRVLTPAFYSRLVHYTRVSEAIDRECVFTDERNRTLWICRPQLLPLLLSKRNSTERLSRIPPPIERGYVEELRWRLMKKLKCPPACSAYTVTPTNSSHTVDDIRPRPYSDLDNFVRTQKNRQYASDYRRISTQLFLAQRLFFGFPEAIDLADMFLRICFCYLGVVQLKAYCEMEWISHMIESCRRFSNPMDWTFCAEVLKEFRWHWWSLSKTVVSVFACHIYGLLKGYS